MEAQSAFVRANGAVELYAIADVHLHFAVVIDPRHTESRDALWLDKTLDELSLLELGMLVVHVFDGFKHFFHGLQKFRLTWMLAFQVLDDLLNFHF